MTAQDGADRGTIPSPAPGLQWSRNMPSQKSIDDTIQSEVKFAERHGTISTASNSEQQSEQGDARDGFDKLERYGTRTLGVLKMRSQYDHDPTDWWFASTAIPLMAATFAPMANLLSIAALVVSWRNVVEFPDDPLQKYAVPGKVKINDPTWCYGLNIFSLICGFLGNFFLLFNFTQRVRYIIALPVTIVFFYVASGVLIAIIVCMERYTPPGPNEVYSQGYWHAVIAACLYLLNSMILMVNMGGYFLGHYPQHFTLTDEQRNLILQTMLFFLWLGGGAGVFVVVEKWSYPDALYFCDVTILTIGFGDYYATTDTGRGLVFPFSVLGTIILGLMVNSIHKFARELSKEKVVRRHVESRRVNTLSRAITLEELDDTNLRMLAEGKVPNISSPLQTDRDAVQQRLDELARQEQEKRRVINFELPDKDNVTDAPPSAPTVRQDRVDSTPNSISHRKSVGHDLFRAVTRPISKPVSFTTNGLRRMTTRNTKKILMVEERDRFNAMRLVQKNASLFNRYYALTMSILAFSMLWCLGAMVFYFAEAETQQLNYFQGLYFCYVSLLTVGYGDLSPKSNAGKAFFVFWSLVAVPTMTILISDLGDTVIGGFKRGVLENDLGLTSSSSSTGRTSKFFHRIFNSHQGVQAEDDMPKNVAPSRLENGRDSIQPSDDLVQGRMPQTIDDLVEDDLSQPVMLKKLAFAIRRTADDLRKEPGKKYKYEEWVEFTRLIRFSTSCASGDDVQAKLDYDEATEGIVDWDWLDEKSPMTSEQSESEWVLDRLCESLLRVFNRTDVLASILAGVQSDKETGLLNSVTSPKNAVGFSTSSKFIDQPLLSSPDAAMDAPAEPKTISTMRRLLQGETGKGSHIWSKRGHARKTAEHHEMVRRRSSASGAHRRRGPFALLHRHSRDSIATSRQRSRPSIEQKGLGIDGVQGSE